MQAPVPAPTVTTATGHPEESNVQRRSPACAGGRFATTKQFLRTALPLAARKTLARLISRQKWLTSRHWWAHELLSDLADADPNEFHRFLWGHHLGYADTYEVAVRFGCDSLHPSRKLLFDDLQECLDRLGVRADSISSVFEVGCSLGYNLRYLETDLFSTASTLRGCDIDTYAVEQGSGYLSAAGSRVSLFTADMAELSDHLRENRYDVMLCAGVLMYLAERDAEEVVASILRHVGVVAVFAGLADPHQDNARLQYSGVRERDQTFIHNVDAMVTRAGGRVVQRRWEGNRSVGGNTVYFVFAVPRGA